MTDHLSQSSSYGLPNPASSEICSSNLLAHQHKKLSSSRLISPDLQADVDLLRNIQHVGWKDAVLYYLFGDSLPEEDRTRAITLL